MADNPRGGRKITPAEMLGIPTGLNPIEALEALRRARRGQKPTDDPPPDTKQAITAETLTLVGHLDVCNANVLEGWISWANFPDLKISLEVYNGDILIGACVADQFREDLEAAGYGHGKCAFAFNVSLEANVQDPAQLRMRLIGTPLFLMPDPNTRRSHG